MQVRITAEERAAYAAASRNGKAATEIMRRARVYDELIDSEAYKLGAAILAKRKAEAELAAASDALKSFGL